MNAVSQVAPLVGALVCLRWVPIGDAFWREGSVNNTAVRVLCLGPRGRRGTYRRACPRRPHSGPARDSARPSSLTHVTAPSDHRPVVGRFDASALDSWPNPAAETATPLNGIP
jgi:hypothetical protein